MRLDANQCGARLLLSFEAVGDVMSLTGGDK